MLSPGQVVRLTIEKPAAGGRMIARADGQVVLVRGAVPGERVAARIERVSKDVAYGAVTMVEEASCDRRDGLQDSLCGGCLYSHIAYPRQLDLKRQVVADAFARIGRMAIASSVPVAASPEEGYRMRARLHMRDGRAGFFREGTHDLCDARATRQLLPETCDVLDWVVAELRSLGIHAVRELEVSENIDASQRVVHLETTQPLDARRLAVLGQGSGLTGLTVGEQSAVGRYRTIVGDPNVADVLAAGDQPVSIRRHVQTFFQGNRYLLRSLVAHVVGCIEPSSSVVDLYAGTGVFSVTAAIARGGRVTAVEGDPNAARDLDENAKQTHGAVTSVNQPVEVFVSAERQRPDVVIVDPPRTGMSREAMNGAIRLRGRRIVYVSCDVATLARDARRLVDAGYAVRQVDLFDLFPNTPHVETVVLLEKPTDGA